MIPNSVVDEISKEMLEPSKKLLKQGNIAAVIFKKDLKSLKESIKRADEIFKSENGRYDSAFVEKLDSNATYKWGRHTPFNIFEPSKWPIVYDYITKKDPLSRVLFHNYCMSVTVYIGSFYIDIYAFSRMMNVQC